MRHAARTRLGGLRPPRCAERWRAPHGPVREFAEISAEMSAHAAFEHGLPRGRRYAGRLSPPPTDGRAFTNGTKDRGAPISRVEASPLRVTPKKVAPRHVCLALFTAICRSTKLRLPVFSHAEHPFRAILLLFCTYSGQAGYILEGDTISVGGGGELLGRWISGSKVGRRADYACDGRIVRDRCALHGGVGGRPYPRRCAACRIRKLPC